MKVNVVGEQAITVSDAKAELEKIKKRDGELNFRANKTEEYMNTFLEINAKQAKEMYEKIDKLGITRFKDTHICKIIDMMPKNEAELKATLQGYNLSISADNQKKILAIVQDHLPKKK